MLLAFQVEVVKNGYVRIERPDWKSNHLVDTQSVNKIEFCQHNQEESNMHRRKVSLVADIHNDNIA